MAPFGNTLHVSADSTEALERATRDLGTTDLAIAPIEPSLEDVFIALMQDANDNFAPPAASGTTATQSSAR